LGNRARNPTTEETLQELKKLPVNIFAECTKIDTPKAVVRHEEHPAENFS
jgi:hypothetical protein